MIVQLLINGISLGSVYALIAVGFALIFNILKFSNFSHGGVLVFSAYAGFVIASNLHTNLFITLILTAIVGGFVDLLIEFVAFRNLRKRKSNPMYYFVSSITMMMLLTNLITIKFSSTFYSYPKFFKTSVVRIMNTNISITGIIMLIISVVALISLVLLLRYTKLGVAIRALSMDVNTTSLMGVNTDLIICATFFVSGCFGGISGVFLGINYTLYPQLGNLVVKGFIASVIGGLGSISGAIVGAVLLGLVEVILIGIKPIGSGLAPVVIFVILLVFLIVRPQGISGKIIKEKA